jgi:filamentous hemagglutinin family protein
MLTTKLDRTPSVKFVIRFLITLGLFSGFTIPTSAQITPGGDSTAVNKVDATTTDITGGKPSGTNLFHSFGTFDLPDKQTANFKSDPGIQNILGRINSGTPSLIDGKIQVNGGSTTSTVNLYLMNPAGIVFGKNASLDVNGAFTATTAKAIGFDNSQWFNALGGNNYPNGNPVNFAFTNTPGSIFNAANLTTKPGKSITLVGGTVISTGDIKTAGGNISIATVEGGKYVQIKADGSILRFDLPAADRTQIQNTPNPNFTPPPLAELLTGRIDSSATGVKIENGVVTLVGNPTAISVGDIVTKNLDTSGDIIGGNLFLNTQTGNIITSDINAASTGQSAFESYEKRYEHHGGYVYLKTQSGDIFVNSIDTSGNNTGGGGSKGGDIKIDAGGLFRAIGVIGLSDTSIATKGNGIVSGSSILDSEFNLGGILITHQGTSFVVGAQVTFTPPAPGPGPNDGGKTEIVLTKDFKFPEDASGTRGAIFTRNTNGTYQVVFRDGSFVSSTGQASGLFGITAVARPPKPDPKTNPDPQASKQKSKENCTPSSTSVVANPTTAPTRSIDKDTSPSVDPCKSKVGTGKILQVLTDKK